MNAEINLIFENRLHLNKDAGYLMHASSAGYYIIDEQGKEVNTFSQEEEFNRLISKFRYRHFLLEKLNAIENFTFDFGQDNVLIVNGKTIVNRYWNLPKDQDEVEMYFRVISDEFVG